jgi:hypothetical protein
VLVVFNLTPTSCPLTDLASGTVQAAPTPSTDHGYQVFLLDARTGRDGVVYTEGGPLPCGLRGRMAPAVDVPLQAVSVPWSLERRDPNGDSATIAARVLSCDDSSSPVIVEPNDLTVRVLVERPLGYPCGKPRPVSITLQAATGISSLPLRLVHAPIGPFLESA